MRCRQGNRQPRCTATGSDQGTQACLNSCCHFLIEVISPKTAKLLTEINLLIVLPELRRSVFFYHASTHKLSSNQATEKKKKSYHFIPKVKNSQTLTAVRWMTPWEVTGQPMKPTNCSSGQFSATARTDRSVTWRKKTSDDYLFINDIQFNPFQLKKSSFSFHLLCNVHWVKMIMVKFLTAKSGNVVARASLVPIRRAVAQAWYWTQE